MVLGALTVAVVGVGTQSIMDRSQFHEAIRGVNALLHAARAQAVRDGARVEVTFNPATRLIRTSAQQELVIPASVDVRWGPGEAGSVGRKDAASPVLFTFAPDGSGHGGHLDLLRVGRGVAFRINWLLGSVEQTEALAQP